MKTMPSEKRLHPSSFLFSLGSHVRELIVPGGFVLLGAGSAGWGWEVWAMLLLVPYAAVSLGRALSFRYRFDERELVLRSGVLFKNERHVPYGRIQNIDAVQNVLHRMLGVAEVRVETGGGSELEAKMQVLPLAAFEEMRAHVFAQARGAAVEEGTAETPSAVPAPPPADVLLQLPVRELLLNGLIQNRGVLVVGGLYGLAWELGLTDRAMGRIFGDTAGDGQLVRQLLLALAGQAEAPVLRLLIVLGAFALVLAALSVLSMAWTLTRLYGFMLTRQGEDLRMVWGLFTRVKATVPMRRIQTLIIREGPLQRLFGRVSIDVDTAGAVDQSGGQGLGGKFIAPILREGEVPRLLRDVLPGIDLTAVDWQPPHPRAFRRVLIPSLVRISIVGILLAPVLKWWALAIVAVLVGWAVLQARSRVRHTRWGVTGDAVMLRRGWLWRRLSLARVTKVQAVAMHESPFDRRHGMASVSVDTAGSHRVDIPYLGREAARSLTHTLAANAARTAFKW
jgi:putative membrane protein